MALVQHHQNRAAVAATISSGAALAPAPHSHAHASSFALAPAPPLTCSCIVLALDSPHLASAAQPNWPTVHQRRKHDPASSRFP
eukprot:349984-Chlamydomonas_euryale.AAC.2